MNQEPNAGANPLPPPPTELLDSPLHLFDFEFDELSAKKVSGHLLITPKCCQVLLLLLTRFMLIHHRPYVKILRVYMGSHSRFCTEGCQH